MRDAVQPNGDRRLEQLGERRLATGAPEPHLRLRLVVRWRRTEPYSGCTDIGELHGDIRRHVAYRERHKPERRPRGRRDRSDHHRAATSVRRLVDWSELRTHAGNRRQLQQHHPVHGHQPAWQWPVDVQVTVAGQTSAVTAADQFTYPISTPVVTLLASPQRLVDTRGSGGGPISAGTSRCFTLAGLGGIPTDAAATVLNVTGASYTANGWLTLYPNGQSVPASSTLNFDSREYAIANGAIVKLGTGGQVCVNAGNSSADVILDATGYVSSSGIAQMPLLASPQRLVDTRGSGGGPISAGTSRCFTLAGLGGIPTNAAAVVLNVTGANYAAKGWLTLYPNGQPVPATSTLNFDTREYAIANGAIVKLGTGGQVCVNAGNSSADVILDATGYVSSSGIAQMPLLASPQRLVDTRGSGGGPISAGTSRCFTLAGRAASRPTPRLWF